MLTALTRTTSPVWAKVSTGDMNIKINDPPPAVPLIKTATIHLQSKQNGSPTRSINNMLSVLAVHSPSTSVSGKLVLVNDFESNDTHFGCSGLMSNDDELNIPDGKWMALMARGECAVLEKVMFAEKYHASAVIVYNRKYIEDEKPVPVYGECDLLRALSVIG